MSMFGYIAGSEPANKNPISSEEVENGNPGKKSNPNIQIVQKIENFIEVSFSIINFNF